MELTNDIFITNSLPNGDAEQKGNITSIWSWRTLFEFWFNIVPTFIQSAELVSFVIYFLRPLSTGIYSLSGHYQYLTITWIHVIRSVLLSIIDRLDSAAILWYQFVIRNYLFFHYYPYYYETVQIHVSAHVNLINDYTSPVYIRWTLTRLSDSSNNGQWDSHLCELLTTGHLKMTDLYMLFRVG